MRLGCGVSVGLRREVSGEWRSRPMTFAFLAARADRAQAAYV